MKPQLHSTAIEMLHRCGEQYRRRYVMGEVIAPAIALIVGSGTHHAANMNLKTKIETGQLLSPDDCAEVARDKVDQMWDKGVWLTEAERQEPKGAVRGAAVDKAVRLSVLHATDLAPTLEPIAAEREWVMEAEGFPFDFAGSIDVQERASLRDLKTGAKSPSAGAADKSDQLTMYALAVATLDGALPEALWLDYVIDLKSGPVLRQQSSTRDQEDIRVFARRLENAAKVIESGIFTPARRSDWWCGPKWCGYYNTCPYVRGRTVHTLGGTA